MFVLKTYLKVVFATVCFPNIIKTILGQSSDESIHAVLENPVNFYNEEKVLPSKESGLRFARERQPRNEETRLWNGENVFLRRIFDGGVPPDAGFNSKGSRSLPYDDFRWKRDAIGKENCTVKVPEDFDDALSEFRKRRDSFRTQETVTYVPFERELNETDEFIKDDEEFENWQPNETMNPAEFIPTFSSKGTINLERFPSDFLENQSMSLRRELKFGEVPPGGEMHVADLELDEGYVVFGFLSSMVVYLQTAAFPMDLVQNWSKNQLSTLQLIIQTIHVEGGFIGCLIGCMFVALALTAVLLAQGCGWGSSSSERTLENLSDTGLRCRKLFLIIVLELVLILLPLGIVGMFLSNEHMSRSIGRTPEVTRVILEDVTTYVSNSNLQIRFVSTMSADQAIDASIEDLEDVDELLGKPIQRELAVETGVDVALDALTDICTASVEISNDVLALRSEAQSARDTARLAQDRIRELRKQVQATRAQCPPSDKPLCDAIDAGSLEIIFRVDRLLGERKLSRLRHLGDANITAAVDEVRREYLDIPHKVVRETFHTRSEIKSILRTQKEVIHDSISSLEEVSKDLTTSLNIAQSHATSVVRTIADFEHWRWLIALVAALLVSLIWTVVTCGVVCAHCGCPQRTVPALIVALVFICLSALFLWPLAAVALVLGGHGELFVCQPLYDSPNYKTLSQLVDNPSVLYPSGGVFSNILRGNDSMNVPVRHILRECRNNQPAFPTFHLNRIFNVESVTNHLTWPKLHGLLNNLTVNISDVNILKPTLQRYLQDLALASRVNLTSYRMQMSGPVAATDLSSFADLLERIAGQLTDLTASARFETLASRTRKIVTNHIQRLEKHKDQIIYKLTSLEVHLLPLQKQANQSLSHLKTTQYYLENQGTTISERVTRDYVAKLVKYLDGFREHVLKQLTYDLSPCKPLWEAFYATRLQICKHIVDPMNGFSMSTIWCLILFIILTPVSLMLIDFYKYILSNGDLQRSMGELLLDEQGPWTTSTPHSPDSVASPEQSAWATPRRSSEQMLIPPPRHSPAQLLSPRPPSEARVSPRPRFHESLRMVEPLSWRSARLASPRGWL